MKSFFDQSVENDMRTYDHIQKIKTCQEDDTNGCLIDYSYFKEYYKMIAIELSKQKVLDADPKAVQQIHFTGNIDHAGNTTSFFIFEEVIKLFGIFHRKK